MVQAQRRLRRPVGTGGGRPRRRVLLTFLLPALALYTVFIVYPLISAAQYSVYSWAGNKQTGFAGLANFRDLFTKYPLSEQVWRALGHNALFFIGTMLIQTTLGLTFAVLLHKSRRGKRFLQTAYTLPHLVSPIVVGYLWSIMLNPQFGAVNAALRGVGLGSLAQPWRGDPHLALPVAIVVNAWQWVGFPMLLFGAALAGIPDEYEQAARVDGASSWKVFRRITLPLLTPVMGIVTVLTFIGTFNVLDLIYALQGSQGNPQYATDVLGLVFYRTAFENPDPNAIGQSCALAVCMFVLIFGVSLVANHVFRRMEERVR
ncbi:sugar ABC transporter permease [Actinoallomurus sp. NPDC050550]|uniref:carbohydrate ABC transporter permease n=1 Tax=Actinoallomurus sp. NPDC050550 TaxID=3154937 RepID=UPI0033DEF6AC